MGLDTRGLAPRGRSCVPSRPPETVSESGRRAVGHQRTRDAQGGSQSPVRRLGEGAVIPERPDRCRSSFGRLAGAGVPGQRTEMLRLAAWRASRSGLDDALLDPRTGQPEQAAAVAKALLGKAALPDDHPHCVGGVGLLGTGGPDG